MRSRKSKFIVNSRLKSYINGDLKLQDFKHPSKLRKQSKSRDCIFYECPSVFPADPLLRNWNSKIESRLKPYIDGQVTIDELIHPSKLKQLSPEELKQKFNKYQLFRLHSHRHPSSNQQVPRVTITRKFKRKKRWFDEKTDFKLQETSATELKKCEPQLIGNRDVVFNGNLNIVCLNIASNNAIEGCDQIENENLKNVTHSYCNKIPNEIMPPNMKELILHAGDQGQFPEHKQLCIRDPNVNYLVRTINKLESAIGNMNQNYLNDFNKTTSERKLFLRYQEFCHRTIKRLTKEINEIENKNQTAETKVENLTNDIKMLRGKIQTLLATSASKMKQLNTEILVLESMNGYLSNSSQQLCKEIIGLKQQNQSLTNVLNHKQKSENQLKILLKKTRDQNKLFEMKLQKGATKNNLQSSFGELNKTLQSNIEDIEREFNFIFTKLQKLEHKRGNDDQNCCSILDTIYTIHEDYSSLKGQVKYFPEKLKNNLAYVTSSMAMLQEQNRCLLRALTFADNEQLSGNEFLKKIKNEK